jgi:tetratricopeptide (TPR) repeat protein/transcriptional regulator with XRE-family HTH domain
VAPAAGTREGERPVAEGPAQGFGRLLRQLRDAAGLTQEELAEAASLSPRSISDLERGINATARPQTARLLAGALGLSGPQRAHFEATARGHTPEVSPAGGPGPRGGSAAAATRTLPRDISGFTGRAAELARLTAGLAHSAAMGGVVGIHAIGGMAGIGKTTLAVHAAHRLAGQFPDGQIFLPLHAHTPGQRPVDPADALASLLRAAGISAQAIPAGLDARAGCWRDYLAGKKVLLVLDDATGHEQVRPLLPGTAGSLVLITSRQRLTALEDAAVISLDTLPPDEAAQLLARLAARPDVAPGVSAVAEVARLCGYLPLAIGMLARQLHHHPAWTPAGLAAELAAARDRLELMHAENLSLAAAFDLSYQDLTAGQRRLFRRLGLHPGPDIATHAAAALAGTTLATARRQLHALYDHHLISEPGPGRYRLHDLLREHAQALAAADHPAAREAAIGRLLDYYLHTALAASEHVPWPNWSPAVTSLPPARPPDCAPPVSTQRQAAAWLEDERANLHAAASHAAVSARPLPAMLIPAAIAGFLSVRHYRDQALTLHQTALAAARQAGDRPGQGRALNLVASAQIDTTQFATAEATLQESLALHRDLGDHGGQADALNGLGRVYWLTGDYRVALSRLQQALQLFRGLGHLLGQAQALNGLGAVRRLTGDYPAAVACHQQALALFREVGHQHGQSEALTHLAVVQRFTGDYPAAAASLRLAQALHRDLGDRYKQAWTRTELGVLQRLTGDYPAAEASHRQALEQWRDIADHSGQARSLDELGLVQQLTSDYPAAETSHQQALTLYRDLGQRQEQAEVLNSLGELSSRCAASQRARHYHNQALAIARDVGAPLEEARALEGIGRCYLQDGHDHEGTTHLQQALAIYQRIGAPGAQRVQQTLLGHHVTTA